MYMKKFWKTHEYDSVLFSIFIIILILCAIVVITNARRFGLTGGPGCGDPKVTVKQPAATTPVTADQNATVKWSACNAPGPWTITLSRSDGSWSTVLGTASVKPFTVKIDSALVKGGSYIVDVASASGVKGSSQSFTLTNPYPGRYYSEIFPNYTLTSDIEYGTAINDDGSTNHLKLDMYQPEGDTGKSRAAIVFIHGGSFTTGDKDMGSNAELFAKSFALRGYVTVSPNYRLHQKTSKGYVSGADQLESMQDVKAAIRFMRANAVTYGIDPNRIAVGGSSAGAALAVMTAYDNEDPSVPGDSTDNATFSSAVNSVMSFKGYLFKESKGQDLIVDSGEPPIVNIIGTLDDFYSAAADLNTLTTTAGIPSLFYPIAGGTHNSIGWANTLQYSVPFFSKWNAGFTDSDLLDPTITTIVVGTGNDGE